MFWGTIITKDKPFQLTKDDLSKVLHLSNATLGFNQKPGIVNPTFVMVLKARISL